MAAYVREAEKEDIMSILVLLRMFAKSTAFSSSIKYFSPRSVTGLIQYSMINGYCLVAVDKVTGKIVGTMLGSIGVNPWTDTTRELREIAWFMDPEFRGDSRAGLRLYKRYVDHSKEMIEEGLIVASHMTTLTTSGTSAEKLVSRDFKKIESHYMMGG
jgi:hypothetical protein